MQTKMAGVSNMQSKVGVRSGTVHIISTVSRVSDLLMQPS